MTDDQIRIVNKLIQLNKDGFIIEAHWAFTGYDCKVVILQNDHDDYMAVGNENSRYKTYKSRWDAYQAGIEWVNKNRKQYI